MLTAELGEWSTSEPAAYERHLLLAVIRLCPEGGMIARRPTLKVCEGRAWTCGGRGLLPQHPLLLRPTSPLRHRPELGRG